MDLKAVGYEGGNWIQLAERTVPSSSLSLFWLHERQWISISAAVTYFLKEDSCLVYWDTFFIAGNGRIVIDEMNGESL